MSDDRYDNLKKKYDALLEENEDLKAKIRKFESQQDSPISPKASPVQNTQSKLIDKLDFDLKSIASPANNIICGDNSVNQFSPINEKNLLFMSLFKGRNDVYAKKWENKKGFSGYSPHCLNEWAPGICNKPQVKCSNCNEQRYSPLDASVVEKHLRGEMIIGIYPMELDETCHFLAIDFVQKKASCVLKAAVLHMNWLRASKVNNKRGE